MKKQFYSILIIALLFSSKAIAQPFVDIVNSSAQTFTSTYKDSSNWKNKTDDYVLNFFLPKEFKNGNTLLVRLNTEMINSIITPDSSYSNRLSSISFPLGFRFLSKNKKWKTVVIAVPKIASNFKGPVNENDFQLGGIFLENYVVNEKLTVKAGLYYNYEAFGDLWVPLVGIDWAATKRINFYGVLPSNYKVEFNIVKNKLYTGLNFKSATRSFRLAKQEDYDYIRYDEMQLKLFLDYFVYKKILLFGEIGYSVGKNPLYKFNANEKVYYNRLYNPLKPYPTFTIGFAYRIRFDLEKKE